MPLINETLYSKKKWFFKIYCIQLTQIKSFIAQRQQIDEVPHHISVGSYGLNSFSTQIDLNEFSDVN